MSACGCAHGWRSELIALETAPLRGYCVALRGQVPAGRFELLNPHMQLPGTAAVPAFNVVSWRQDGSGHRWTYTGGLGRAADDGCWQLIHTQGPWTLPGAPR